MFDQSIDPKALILLARADHLGRTGATILEENEDFLWARLALYEEIMARPYVKGSDLVNQGLTPGPEFSEILAYSHKLRLAGIDKEIAMKQTIAFARKRKKENKSVERGLPE